MAKRKGTENRTNKNRNTVSQQRSRANSAIDGRGGRYSSYTGGARTAEPVQDKRGYSTSERDFMRQAWNEGRDVATMTRTRSGQMSANGRTRGGLTWAMTPKNDDGSAVLNKSGEARQSGRSQLATTRQRDYDNRKAMNNITQRTVDAWKRLGWVREVNGNMVGDGQNVRGITIHQKADGNYSMGLTTG